MLYDLFLYKLGLNILIWDYIDDKTIIFLMKQLYCNNYCFRWQTIILTIIFLFK